MQEILVQKFGGTSVGDPERIRRVAERIKRYYEKGYRLVVVVSAMGHTTDELIALAGKVAKNPPKREMDMLLATGEQVSIALLAMALHEIGVPARSFTGGQVNILTDGNFSNARIESIDTSRLLAELDKGQVCIVAGFQGVDQEQNITTLGRGGSDTTAVALAAALKASECEIYTDVDGVYTTDPNKVEEARKLKQISYDEMLELASLGAGVLHNRSVEFAKKYGVTIHVRSSFNFNEGTKVVSEDMIMEKLTVTGVTLKSDDARMTVADIPDRPGIAAELFQALADKKINIDMIVQSTGKDRLNTISFTLPVAALPDARQAVESLIAKWGSGSISTDENIAIVSAVGVGMKSHTGVAASMFRALAEHNINIEMISTSEIKISCVIARERGREALRLIHSVFGLDKIH
ncbi:MAG: aspartate kinase [Turneriella sp.]|nr:aspartate kinase [Leptospiraceae bacterium]MCX7632760.1 aspartate kinase [Turneriella sp.]